MHGQLSAVPYGVALRFNPCHQLSRPIGRSNSSQNRQAVAQQVETVAVKEFVGVEGVIPESGAFDDLRSALKARLKGLPRGL
jgi:hypothetical protein